MQPFRSSLLAILRLVVVGCLLARPKPVLADESLFLDNGGLNVGYTSSNDRRGLLLGAEWSFLYLHMAPGQDARFGIPKLSDIAWLGVYGDALWDQPSSAVRLGLGPEAGIGGLGIDGGLALERRDGAWSYGWQIRPVVTVGFLAIYSRWTYLEDDQERWEMGLLVKAPVIKAIFD